MKIKKSLSLVIALSISLSMASLPFAYAEELQDDAVYTLVDESDENYIPYEEIEVFTFDELLNMSDEEYIKLNTSYIPPENIDTTIQTYKFLAGFLQFGGTYRIVPNEVIPTLNMEKIEWPLYNKELYIFTGDVNSEEQRELNEKINNSLKNPYFDMTQPVRAIIKRTDDNSLRAVSTIRPNYTVSIDKTMGITSFNQKVFLKKLKEVFGDSLNYTVYKNPGAYEIYFDFDDLTLLENGAYDYNIKNILYFSKVLRCIYNICPTAHASYEFLPTDIKNYKVYKHDKNSIDIFYGDANEDGIVDVADLVAISAYVGNSESNKLSEQGLLNADVHSEGNGITADDALAVQQDYLAKKTFG